MTDVVMPQMGESIVEGTLTKWLKKPGDHVERDEPLFEISTDKVDTEIPSPCRGHAIRSSGGRGQDRRHRHRGGPHRRSGSGAAPAAAAPAAEAAAPAASAAPPAARASQAQCPRCRDGAAEPAPAAAVPPVEAPAAAEPTGPLSPLVRRMAREYSIDLSKVKGTGAGGRITKQDLEGHIASQPQETRAAASLAPAPRCTRCAAPVQTAPAPPPVEAPAPPPATPPSAAASRRPGQDADRAHEHHAHPHRRAYGRQPPHLGARHHHP